MSLSDRIEPISYLKADASGESLALLRILALGSRQIEAGQVQPAAEVVARLRERHRAD